MKHEDMKHEEEDNGRETLTFLKWAETVPAEIRGDTLWMIEAYRLGLYLGDLAWGYANRIAIDFRLHDVADQLRRATRRISACIAEGYSRDTGKGRSTYYEYALGSSREARDWVL